MESLPLAQLQFWDLLSQKDRGVLLLDYDGTLAPFVVDRERAFPYPEIVPPLQQIIDQGKTRVVIVSGREIASLSPLLPFSPLPELFGNHGYEHLLPDGSYHAPPLSSETAQALDQVEKALVEQNMRSFIERKPASVALHWRGATREERQRVLQAFENILSPLSGRADLEIHPFDGGWELRLTSYNKGHAIQRILTEEPSNTPIAYLGDDQTDEDAFLALQGKGLCVLVRTQHRPSRADLWLQPPKELVAFLEQWRESLSRKGGA